MDHWTIGSPVYRLVGANQEAPSINNASNDATEHTESPDRLLICRIRIFELRTDSQLFLLLRRAYQFVPFLWRALVTTELSLKMLWF